MDGTQTAGTTGDERRRTASRRRRLVTAAAALALASFPTGGWAAERPNPDLQFFEEEAKVITATRREQSSRESPMSVEVITAEDVKASGAVNLWDLMRFRAGMDVLETRDAKLGGRAIVSIRGFPGNFVNNLQVLVDGRSVYAIDSGGVLWEQLPVQVQDIDRIEIVRGPNAALYGSNTGIGVINIITRRPASRLAVTASGIAGSLGGDRHLRQAAAAVEHTVKDFSYRLSYSHRADDGFPNANGDKGNDFIFSNKGNFRGDWRPSDDTSLELFSGGSWDTAGQPPAITPNSAQSRVRSHFQMLKLGHTLPGGSAAQMFVSRSEQRGALDPAFGGFSFPSDLGTVESRNYQYDVDFQHRFGWSDDRCQSVWGGDWREAVAWSDQRYTGAPRQEDRTVRGFYSNSVQLTPKSTALGAVSLENSDYGGLQPAYTLALLHRVAEGQVVRISNSLAPSQPSAFKLHANNESAATSALVGNPALPAEHLYDYEIGYMGDYLERHLTTETNLYYQRLRGLPTKVLLSKAGPLTTNTFALANEAIERGLEARIGYQWSRLESVYANYSFESITDWTGAPAHQRGTPVHEFNLGGRVDLTHGFSASANAGWKDGYLVGNPVTLTVRPYWRLDARVAYSQDAWEVFVAGQNLSRPVHQAEFAGFDVPRTFLGGFDVRFR